ncbi:SH3 domain-containing protein [Neptuniibacter caesariensis]|uniref:SH3b domain-containing protein n=1 Tax=Neptuniibacter caesariensis TaxID=207954 RepID=A0A7U8CAQ9_NEPCE|nr:SH3 domain-containing protein [Neptuniibacter caesariensis]EAR62976.1 hypothetical protein MED92_07651 [Oceanospirillum sp. MED92] [Neptuniibacter caesariensis]
MKNFAPLLFSLFCILSANASALDYFNVNADKVNVRKGPGQNWKVVAQVDAGQLVLETQRAGQWSEIFFVKNSNRKFQGWIFNAFLTPQQLDGSEKKQPYQLDVSALKPVCTDRTVVGIGSLCYLDVSFVVTFEDESTRQTKINCWADFVVPGDKEVVPIQTSDTQLYHVLGGKAEGVMRLNAGMQRRVDSEGLNLAYYNCAVE